jgi:endonuclease/exonuclease/phosphatase family metal-dependent hydrolase
VRFASFNQCSGRRFLPAAPPVVVTAQEIASAAGQLDADVLAVQEVDVGQPRSGATDQAATIADGMHAVDWRFAATIVGTPGVRDGHDARLWRRAKDEPHDAGPHDAGPHDVGRVEDRPRYGIVLASRLPVRAWHLRRLRPAPGWYPLPLHVAGRTRWMLLRDEPRAVLAAELILPDGATLVVGCTHLSFVPGVNVAQLGAAARWLRRIGPPDAVRVFLGDLNLPAGVVRRVGAAAGGWERVDGPATYPAHAPRAVLDHVLTRGLAPREPARAVRMPFSDHTALVSELPL